LTNMSKHTQVHLVLVVAVLTLCGFSHQNSGGSATTPQSNLTERHGEHDFDFEIGTWKTHLKRLAHPLTGSTTWIEYEGTTVVRKIWNGGANLVELEVDAPNSHIEALSLRLYNPQSHQWSLNFASSSGGTVGIPTVGEFKNGRGEFFDQETLNGRALYVRFVISEITLNSCHFEQAFSDDGGKTWEVNWVATDTRVPDDSAAVTPSFPPNSAEPNHDFDFSIGSWKTHIKRLQHPLTGSTTWMDYEGTSIVRKIWNGRASLGETEAAGPTGHLEALSLRLYNPGVHQWELTYANGSGGTLSVPTIGEFKNGRGEFFDTEPFNGKSILVRQVWSDITPNSCRFEQAFSDDGGKTWEVNWIATDTRTTNDSATAEISPAHDGLARLPSQSSTSYAGFTRSCRAWEISEMLAGLHERTLWHEQSSFSARRCSQAQLDRTQASFRSSDILHKSTLIT